jgi:histidine ammonia-lyase
MAAGFKARRILQNAQRVVAAELLSGAQGLDFLKPLKPGRGVAQLYQRIRGATPPVPTFAEDRTPAPDLRRLAELVSTGMLDPA